jgi:transcription initiation factor TFIIB
MYDTCKNCEERGLTLDINEGNVTCTQCGHVQSRGIIDESSEWRNFAKESSSHGGDDPKRVGEANNNLLPDRGICTVISGNGTKDIGLARWNQRSLQGTVEKTLSRGFKSIDDLCNSLNLTDVIKEEAKILFKKIDDQKSLKGRAHNAIVSSCVFISCRKKNNPRSIREISQLLNIDRKDILKCYSLIKKIAPSAHTNKSAAEYSKRYASELQFSEQANRISQHIAERAIENGLVTGKSPLSVASAAVYLVGKLSGEPRSYTEVTEVSSMKEITIKNCYKSFSPYIDVLLEGITLPPGWDKLNLQTDKDR